MKKKSVILAGLLIATIVTGYSVAGTYAKYTSATDLTDEARVAKWNLTAIDYKTSQATNTLNLFSDSYSINEKGLYVKSLNNEKVMAPGTKGEYQINFAGDIEVRYMLNLDFDALDDSEPGVYYGFGTDRNGNNVFIKGYGDKLYSPITYRITLYNGFKNETYGTFEGTLSQVREQMRAFNESAETEAVFEPGNLGLSCKIEWQWNAENVVDGLTPGQVNDLDTYLGELWSNMESAAKYKLTITATQVAEDHATRSN